MLAVLLAAIRAAIAAAVVLTATGCTTAASFHSIGPKVQTFHELMVKLKKGFDEGTLDTPDFYARELGYPLDRPGTLRAISPPFTPAREIRFDSGELAGTIAYVRADAAQGSNTFVVFSSLSTTIRAEGTACVNVSDIQRVWGVMKPEPDTLGFHGALPIDRYVYTTSDRFRKRVARFSASKTTGCIGQSFSVAQYLD